MSRLARQIQRTQEREKRKRIKKRIVAEQGGKIPKSRRKSKRWHGLSDD